MFGACIQFLCAHSDGRLFIVRWLHLLSLLYLLASLLGDARLLTNHFDSRKCIGISSADRNCRSTTGTVDKDALVRAAALAAIRDVAPFVWQLAAGATQTTIAATHGCGALASDYTRDVTHQHLLKQLFVDVAAR